jgi:hypothetical protein
MIKGQRDLKEQKIRDKQTILTERTEGRSSTTKMEQVM